MNVQKGMIINDSTCKDSGYKYAAKTLTNIQWIKMWPYRMLFHPLLNNSMFSLQPRKKKKNPEKNPTQTNCRMLNSSRNCFLILSAAEILFNPELSRRRLPSILPFRFHPWWCSTAQSLCLNWPRGGVDIRTYTRQFVITREADITCTTHGANGPVSELISQSQSWHIIHLSLPHNYFLIEYLLALRHALPQNKNII